MSCYMYSASGFYYYVHIKFRNVVNCVHRHEQTIDDMKEELAVISSVSVANSAN